MIATAKLISNVDAIIENKRQIEVLGLKSVEYIKPEYVDREFCFPLHAVLCAYRLNDGNIKIMLNGQEMILVYDEKTYERLREHFKNI